MVRFRWLTFAGHCDPYSNGCTNISSDKKPCLAKGIKVMLYIGGGAGSYDLTSTEDATYLRNNFLGGQSSSHPLGPAILDGIDFDIEGGTDQHRDDFSRSYTKQGKRVYFTAAPPMPIPWCFDRKVVLTPFEFNYTTTLLASILGILIIMKMLGNNAFQVSLLKIFSRVYPAAPDAAGSDFIPVSNLSSKVLAAIKGSTRYGGVML